MKLTKNILIISSEFPPQPGGIGNHALHLAKNLQQNGYALSVLTNQRDDLNNEILFDNQLPFSIYRIKRSVFPFLTYFDRICKAFSLAKNSNKIIVSGKFSLWIGGMLKLFYKNKTIIAILHGSEINAGGKFFTNWSVSKFDKLVAVSNYTKSLMLQNNSNLKIEVINNGFELFTNKPILNYKTIGKPAIITIGNVTYRKGQQNVINALPSLKKNHANIHYHIIGIPTKKESFTTLAKNLKVLGNISFHNAISNDEKYVILSESKVFFMLSDSLKNGDVEGFGIAVLEANALGIPAIGSKNSGIADAISDGFSGKLVNPHDVNEISSAFNEIMNNYDFYSKNALEWSKQFSWDIIIKQYLKVLES